MVAVVALEGRSDDVVEDGDLLGAVPDVLEDEEVPVVDHAHKAVTLEPGEGRIDLPDVERPGAAGA